MPISIRQSALALENAARELETLREYIASAPEPTNALEVTYDRSLRQLVGVISHCIEAVGIIGENVATMQGVLATAGAVLADSQLVSQCPECGLPIGTNASKDEHTSGCTTCTIAAEIHERQQGNKCPDCGCLIATNGDNCRRCLDEAYFQRVETAQRGQAGNRCSPGNECGRVGCPMCQQ